jgi:hypothetical protein
LNINVENCIKNKVHLDIHPEWWNGKTDEEIKLGLIEIAKEIAESLDRISKYENKTVHEMLFIEDLKKYLNIMCYEIS